MISAVDGMDGARGWAGRASSTGAETCMGVGSGLRSSGRSMVVGDGFSECGDHQVALLA